MQNSGNKKNLVSFLLHSLYAFDNVPEFGIKKQSYNPSLGGLYFKANTLIINRSSPDLSDIASDGLNTCLCHDKSCEAVKQGESGRSERLSSVSSPSCSGTFKCRPIECTAISLAKGITYPEFWYDIVSHRIDSYEQKKLCH